MTFTLLGKTYFAVRFVMPFRFHGDTFEANSWLLRCSDGSMLAFPSDFDDPRMYFEVITGLPCGDANEEGEPQ